MPILVSALSSIQLLSVLSQHLVICQFSFSLVFIVVHFPERTETGLNTESEQTVCHTVVISGFASFLWHHYLMFIEQKLKNVVFYLLRRVGTKTLRN